MTASSEPLALEAYALALAHLIHRRDGQSIATVLGGLNITAEQFHLAEEHWTAELAVCLVRRKGLLGMTFASELAKARRQLGLVDAAGKADAAPVQQAPAATALPSYLREAAVRVEHEHAVVPPPPPPSSPGIVVPPPPPPSSPGVPMRYVAPVVAEVASLDATLDPPPMVPVHQLPFRPGAAGGAASPASASIGPRPPPPASASIGPRPPPPASASIGPRPPPPASASIGPRPPVPASASIGPRPPPPERDSLDETLGIEAAISAKAMPFVAARQAPSLPLEQYAAMTAALEAFPERQEVILGRYGVAADGLETLHASWRRVFDTDPSTRDQWRERHADYAKRLKGPGA